MSNHDEPQESPFLIAKELDHLSMEERCRSLWEETGIYRHSPTTEGEIFSVDTPPPYVSAAHLHVGHAMSYSQAEFIIRYQRMRGRKIFYPMGFDDNGLPTERFVEKKYSINKRKTTRSEFRALCLDETKRGAAVYEELWRALGLSVDWSLRYSTIDDHCRRSSQRSFVDLYHKGRVYRSKEPVLWDVHFETSLAQADLETLTRKGKLYDIQFRAAGGDPLIISTTRPELIPACVGLYFNPRDERYQHLSGTEAEVPLSGGRKVPILTDDEVKTDFGTGLMMVCTFGDGEDVKRWKRDGLETRLIIEKNGRMNQLAGPYESKTVDEARKLITKDLEAAGDLLGFKMVEQNVSVSERSSVPVEFHMTPQWFIRVMDVKDELLERSNQIRWHPDWMKVRLDQWIEGLRYDWNISRQRFYGVPVPVWFCAGCDAPVVASEDSLPVDPLEDPPPCERCEQCGGTEFVGDPDVMDTWMTSSMSSLINTNWVGTEGRVGDMSLYPMTVRVQAFEIIRTWLFYSVVKSHFHTDSLPWRDVMISGWGLNEQGKKISKRDLEKHTGADGYNRYEPYAVIKRYGADPLRYWAAGSNLGSDTRFNERDVKNGRRLVIKLWNAARFVGMQLEGFDPKAERVPFAQRTPEDRWVLTELNKILPTVADGFDTYNYSVAREATDTFFRQVFTDNYLEMVKDRFWHPERHEESARASARATMWETLRTVLALYAPFMPFVTEELYQRLYRPYEDAVSLHVSPWPEHDPARTQSVPEMDIILGILLAVRRIRTDRRISQTREIEALIIDLSGAASEVKEAVERLSNTLQAVARTKSLSFGQAEQETDIDNVRIELVEHAS
ncbi:valine--tRNA ligase [Haliangium sp.]|uniref:valine--tRNA ligase n=1 Tax=Haliangium sp. TaxID=2663208 RepID=UPI003D144DF1